MKTKKFVSIRTKLLIGFTVIFFIISALMTYLLRDLYLKAFENFENLTMTENMNKVKGEIDDLAKRMATSCRDWAIWDDSYIFAQRADNSFIERNLIDENFDNYKVNLILFVDGTGSVLYGKQKDNQGGPVRDIDQRTLDAFKSFGIFNHSKTKTDFNGLIFIEESPMIISTAEILKTDGSGPSVGHVIFGCVLDNYTLDLISETLNMKVTGRALLKSTDKDLIGISDNQIKIIPIDEQSIVGRIYLPEMGQNYYEELSVEMPRSIMAIGYRSTIVIMILVPFILFIVFAILLFGLNWLVLTRITTLNAQVMSIKENQSPSTRVSEDRSCDEISHLSEEINLMLAGLEVLQNGLIEAKDTLEQKVIDRTQTLQITNERLEVEIIERQRIQEEVTYLAYHDNLTGLPNRLLVTDRINQGIILANRREIPISVMFIDLDGFKVINDTLGHQQGDLLLKQVGERLVGVIRKNDTVCRIGGDEFVLFINGYHHESDLEIIAHKIIDSFREPFILKDHEYYITSSMGIAQYPIDGDDVETLMKNADMAMYEAKNRGKNQFQKCSKTLRENALETMAITNSLHRAIDRGEMQLFYQPQVNAATGKIEGVEALIRWNHPEFGFISPAKFIPIAEKTRLILPIGHWVLRTACQQCKAWQDKGFAPIRMAVNFSIHQMNQPNIKEIISEVLNEFELHPKYLEMELTESIAMDQKGHIKGVLSQLKSLGVSLSIDDFGTEYSSLSRLKDLPIDRIKIDMSFVFGIGNSEKDEAIIKTIILLAKNLGLATIAEGVETQMGLDFLNAHGCDELQGYWMYKPMPADDLEAVFKAFG